MPKMPPPSTSAAVPEWLEWAATAVTFAVYFAYILAIAFWPGSLALRIAADSALTWGMVGGAAVIVFSIGIAAWYTARASRPPAR